MAGRQRLGEHPQAVVGAGQDQRDAAQPAQRHGAPRQRAVGGGDQAHALAQQRIEAQRAGVLRHVEDGEIEPAVGELLEELAGQPLDEAQPGAGVTLPQRLRQRREEHPGEGRLGGDVELGRPLVGARLQRLLCLGEQAGDGGRVFQQSLAALGGRHAPPAAVQQACPQPGLELAEAAAEGGLIDAHFDGRPGDAARLDDAGKEVEIVRVHVRSPWPAGPGSSPGAPQCRVRNAGQA